MVAAKKHQTRSTGDMLAALGQANGQSKRTTRQLTRSQFCVENGHLIERFHSFADQSEQQEGADSDDIKKAHRDEDHNEGPLLEPDGTCARLRPRWKSCRWLGEQNQQVDESPRDAVERATSKKSLLESLFSIQAPNVELARKCTDASKWPRYETNERRRISEDSAQLNESELLLAASDADKGEGREREEAARAQLELHRASLSWNASSTGVSEIKLSGLFPHGTGGFSPAPNATRRPPIATRRRQSEAWPGGDGDHYGKQAEPFANLAQQIPADEWQLSKRPIEHQQPVTGRRVDEGSAGDGLARNRQQALGLAATGKLASSSPILSPATLKTTTTTTNSNYDATGDRSGERANKEFCDDATATCNSGLGGRAPTGQRAARAVADRTGAGQRRQVAVSKVARDERRTARRSSRQLEKVAASKLERRRRATNERDLFLRFGERTDNWPVLQTKSQGNLTDNYNRGRWSCSSDRAATDSVSLSLRQLLRNEPQDDLKPAPPSTVANIAHGLESWPGRGAENGADAAGRPEADAKDNADESLSPIVCASPQQVAGATSPRQLCDGQRATAENHQRASSTAVGQLPVQRQQQAADALACQLTPRDPGQDRVGLGSGGGGGHESATNVTNEIRAHHSNQSGTEIGELMAARATSFEEAPLVVVPVGGQREQQARGERKSDTATGRERVASANLASSWRRQLVTCPALVSQLGGVGVSGSYKVAQQQSGQISSSNRSSQTNQQTPDANSMRTTSEYCGLAGQEVEACDNSGRTQEQDSARHLAGQRRLSRPGRSPISLQRQTNARLARHRLKIRQQRQEQLASLALREREQLRTARQGQHQHLHLAAAANPSSQSAYGNNNEQVDIEILAQEQSNQHRATSTTSQSGGFFSNLLQRLPGRGVAIGGSVQLQAHQWRRNQREPRDRAEVALVNFGHQQQVHPSRGPSRGRPDAVQATNHSVPIDVCDGSSIRVAQHHNQPPSGHMTTIDCELLNAACHQGRQPGNARSAHLQQQRQSTNNTVGFNSNQPTSGRQHCQTTSQMASSKRNSADSAFCAPANSPPLSESSSASSSVLSLNKPFCKICHLSSNRNGSDKLISPCKCSGTMQHVHCGCLLKWLEISNRTNEKPISCELCSHEYTWHKRFNYKQMRLPKCSSKDVMLHLIFVLALGGMLFCAVAPVFYGGGGEKSSLAASNAMMMSAEQQAHDSARPRETSYGNDLHTNKVQARNGNMLNVKPSPFRVTHQSGGVTTFSQSVASSSQSLAATSNGRLANDEKFILACAAFFFISFFIAIYAQTKTRDTLYGLIVKFTNMNLTYFITEYDHGNANTTASPGSTGTISSGGGGGDSGCNNIDDHSSRSNHSEGSVVEHTHTGTSRDPNNIGQHNHKHRNNKHLHG